MNSNEYWRKREADAMKHYVHDEKEYQKRLAKIYQDMLDACQKEIESFYAKYAAAERITLAEAKRRVSKADIAALERKAEKYVRTHDFSQRANAELRLYNATMKINRLEMLKANLGLDLIAGHDEMEKFMGDILQGRTEEELKRQAGILGRTVRNNAQLANAIVNASFHNATFSDRIWAYQDLLREELGKLLQSGLIQGKNPRQLARQLRETFDTTRGHAERLMRTELARVQTEAQKQSFQRNGFSKYEFIANGGCCSVCAGLNGKHFEVEKMEPGLNAPPVHPNCRCSIASWEDGEEYEAWLDYLDQGGTTAAWEQSGKAAWRKKSGKSLDNSGYGGTLKPVAIAGARNPYGEKADEHAQKYYGLVRHMKTDVAKIAKTTGLSVSDVQKIKKFIFMDKHDLGGPEPEYFAPDFMMAESWQRLIDGKAESHDITLLKHELLEQKLMEQGLSQAQAHIEASKKYNYGKEAAEFYGKIEKYSD